MKLLTIIVTFIVIVEVFGADENYCNEEYTKLCNGTAIHVGCSPDYKKELADSCPKDAQLYKPEEIKEHFLYYHNYYRNMLASGRITKFKPAARMATVQWDDELAKLAQWNSMTCKMDHDKCRATVKFHQAGQNLAGMGRSADNINLKELANLTLYMWFNESTIATLDDMKAFNIAKYKKIGHFQEMSLDKQIAIGCSMIKFTEPGNKFVTIIAGCNYASIYMPNEPIYEFGRPVTKCKTGANPEFPALCSIKEEFKPNWF